MRGNGEDCAFGFRGQRPVRTVAVCLIVLAVSGCLAGGAGRQATPTSEPTVSSTATPTAAPTASPTTGAALDSRLAGLLDADNRTAYADRHGLELDDGRVRVVTTLRDGMTLPDDLDLTVELRAGNEVLLFVAITDLRGLARSPNVSSVRVPTRPYSQERNRPPGDRPSPSLSAPLSTQL